MASKTLDIERLISPDRMGIEIANFWLTWNTLRADDLARNQEIRRYVFATDTTHTTNSKLPWSNTTTIPKLTQVRENLYANYMAALFPKRDWLEWEAADKSSNGKRKRRKIENYMKFAIKQPQFREEMRKLLLDYIDEGNCFVMPEWVDETTEVNGSLKSGFVGPRPRRIAPKDIVFNPTAENFHRTPKIIRSLMSIGEAKEFLERVSVTPTEKEVANQVWQYCMDLRNTVMSSGPTEDINVDAAYQVDGFTSYRHYLSSSFVELLTFCGDLYDVESNTLLKNHMIVVMDRHKIIVKKPYPYPLAEIPIYHQPWRVRQDNIWGMSPLANLVGMQYRLDHIENLKADLVDLTAFPPVKIKGLVSEFEWGPLEKIFVDADGDVELLQARPEALQLNIEIDHYEALMEAMAGSPKEAMGFRTPGEKTAYEVQRLENAASRIFQAKINQFSEGLLEPLLNSMLVLAQQNLQTASFRVITEEFGAETFEEISQADISANGKIKPVAAAHFAEKAERVQNLNNFFLSPMGQDPAINVHMSGLKLAQLIEELLDLEEYELVLPYVRLSEQAAAQRQQMSYDEGTLMEAGTPAGITPDDTSDPLAEMASGSGLPSGAPQDQAAAGTELP